MGARLPLTCAVLALLAPPASAGVDAWSPVSGAPFSGDANVRDLYWLEPFGSELFVGTLQQTGPGHGTAQIWHTTDGATFAQSGPFSPSLAATPPDVGVAVFGMVASATTLYAGFAGPPSGSYAGVYGSTDGRSFSQVNGAASGFAPAGNSAALPSPVIFGGALYFGTRNASGTQVWRRPLDLSAPWEKVLDGAALGVSPVQQMTTWMWVFRGQVYAATTGGCGCGRPQSDIGSAHLWRSPSGNPGSWVEVAPPGLGDPDNQAIASMAELGGMLYAGTTNRADGGQLWRSADGARWEEVVGSCGTRAAGFGTPGATELHELRTIDGRLWVTTARPEAEAPGSTLPVPPPEVWRSDDGISFVRSNDPGFDGSAIGGYPMLAGFGGAVYATARGSAGAQLWRMTGLGAGNGASPPARAPGCAGGGRPAPGAPTTGPGSPGVDRPGDALPGAQGAPVVRSFTITPRRFAVAARPTAVRATAKGSAFRFVLSQRATVTIAIARAERGVLVGSRCRAAPRRGRRPTCACTAYSRIGALTRSARRGANVVAFSGRIGRRALRPGQHRATLVAVDPSGRRSRQRSLTFTIVRR